MSTSSSAEFERLMRQRASELARYGPCALGALYDLCGKRLVRFALMVTRQQQDAEDAVQAALTKIAARPQLLAAAARPWPYLIRIVRNEAQLVIRRSSRLRFADRLDDLVSYCPVDQLEREDTYRAVYLALRQLPSDQAEVVALKIWEEMTFVEIAQVLDVSQNTVASRYRYALQKLSVLLRPQAAEVHHA